MDATVVVSSGSAVSVMGRDEQSVSQCKSGKEKM
jgi:hypothetical protein